MPRKSANYYTQHNWKHVAVAGLFEGVEMTANLGALPVELVRVARELRQALNRRRKFERTLRPVMPNEYLCLALERMNELVAEGLGLPAPTYSYKPALQAARKRREEHLKYRADLATGRPRKPFRNKKRVVKLEGVK